MIMDLIPTPSQTIGPFFHLCLTPHVDLGGLEGQRIRLVCRILDGDRTPVNDALIEVWQADAAGEYGYFGRLCTNENGVSIFETVKPGSVEGQAPHLNVMIFARGLLKQLYTRIYFDGESSNGSDSVLALVPKNRRCTLMARPSQGDSSVWNFDIRLCAECETVFFDV
jgi:protocatechuate 3,4-dioxygenase alpha subunit